MRRIRSAVFWACGIVVGSLALGDDASLRLIDGRQSVFGGRGAAWRVEGVDPAGGGGSVAWSVSVEGGVIARQEPRVALRPGEPVEVEVEVDLPGVSEGVVAGGLLRVVLRDEGGGPRAELEHPFHVFGGDPAAGKGEWLRGLDLRVYDPDGRTAERLDEMGWPYRRVTNLSALEGMGGGVLVVGEGCALQGMRGGMESAARVAQRGGAVVFLAPADGGFPLPGSGVDAGIPESLRFHGSSYVGELDKRLEAPPRRAGFRLGVRRGEPVVSVESGGGWAFMEARWAGGGALLLCGCGLLDTWEASPSPRFLLVRMLEQVIPEKEKEP